MLFDGLPMLQGTASGGVCRWPSVPCSDVTPPRSLPLPLGTPPASLAYTPLSGNRQGFTVQLICVLLPNLILFCFVRFYKSF